MRHAQQTLDASDLNRNFLAVLQQEVDMGADALRRGRGDVAVTMFQSALSKMSVQLPFYDHIVHNLLLSYKLVIENLLRSGDTETSVGFLNSALKLEIAGQMVSDREFRGRFADAFQNLGLVFFENGHFEASLACCRKANDVEPNPTYNVNLSNTLSVLNRPALLSDFTNEITSDRLGRHIFIACVPKSASTFLKNVLLNLTGYRDLFAVQAAGQNEHDLYLPAVRALAEADTVTQQHCRGSYANIQIMQAFGIRPVVLVRNIFDSVMSLLDFYIKNGAYRNTYYRGDFLSLDEETQVDLLIDNVVPWYLQFVASWSLAESEGRIDLKWLSYEELLADKQAAIADVLRFYGLGASVRNVEVKIKETESQENKIRFNKGVAGRGKAGLNDQQKERIRRLTRYYPSTNFSRIGL